MGNYFTVNMEENFKKNQEFIQSINKVKMERQIQLQYQHMERIKAMEIAKYREYCFWLVAFYGTAAVGLFTGFRRTKRSYFLAPLLPLTFVTAYSLDMGYGNKAHRIRMEAEHIMQHEHELLEVPCGLPTPSSIDLGRMDVEEKKRLHPHQLACLPCIRHAGTDRSGRDSRPCLNRQLWWHIKMPLNYSLHWAKNYWKKIKKNKTIFKVLYNLCSLRPKIEVTQWS